MIVKSTPKQGWTPSESAFNGLLAWLDGGTDSRGQSYVEARRRLVSYFLRKRCPSADDLADETLNRVARRLEEEGEITDASPSQYCYIVAKFVFLEYLRRTERMRATVTETTREAVSEDPRDEELLQCLDRCLATLTRHEREIILGYYKGDPQGRIAQRHALAVRLGMSANALAIRACRIRDKLQACVSGCAGSR